MAKPIVPKRNSVKKSIPKRKPRCSKKAKKSAFEVVKIIHVTTLLIREIKDFEVVLHYAAEEGMAVKELLHDRCIKRISNLTSQLYNMMFSEER